MNRTSPSLHGGLLEITLTVPLNANLFSIPYNPSNLQAEPENCKTEKYEYDIIARLSFIKVLQGK